MALRDFGTVDYIPILGLRPAEMDALRELPNSDKDELLPLVGLRRWASSHQLTGSTTKIETCYGDRPLILELGEEEPVAGARRQVHEDLDSLRDAHDGYANWCDFIARNENFIPSLQITDPRQMALQAERLAALQRGVVVRLGEDAHYIARDVATILREHIDDQEVCFIVDYLRQPRDFLNRQRDAIATSRNILGLMPNAYIAFSASSFPDTFVGLDRQAVHERSFYNSLRPHIETGRLIYSDRGSARVERQQGGSGAPAPRIDYATSGEWTFFREECDEGEDRFEKYKDAAERVMGSPEWDPDLRLWGSQMIERTSNGDRSAIYWPQASTAARINIHLHRQLLHDRPDELYETEDDWSDL